MSKVVIVDFDGTIVEFAYPEMGKPQPRVKENLQKLRDKGFQIHILSCRTNRELAGDVTEEAQVKLMMEYLDKHEIPYDKVLNEHKPFAVWYIDDRGIGFRGDWDKVVEEIVYE